MRYVIQQLGFRMGETTRLILSFLNPFAPVSCGSKCFPLSIKGIDKTEKIRSTPLSLLLLFSLNDRGNNA
jgi:hypothetical protein